MPNNPEFLAIISKKINQLEETINSKPVVNENIIAIKDILRYFAAYLEIQPTVINDETEKN